MGLERAGMETVAFCEIDKFCQEILKKHWPDIPIHSDITKLDGKQYAGSIDLICGGFPCQPFSVAGKQKGKDDNRHLWPEMLQIVSESKPTWFIGENVPGIINLALEQVCADLEAQGYEVQTLVIPACAVDAPHRRSRTWIIANAKHLRRHTTAQQGGYGKAVFSSEEGEKISGKLKGIYSPLLMANPNGARCEKQDAPLLSESKGHNTGASIAIRHDGRIKPTIRRNDNGIPNRMDRLKSLGNAVVPQIPEIIGKYIMEIENN